MKKKGKKKNVFYCFTQLVPEKIVLSLEINIFTSEDRHSLLIWLVGQASCDKHVS